MREIRRKIALLLQPITREMAHTDSKTSLEITPWFEKTLLWISCVSCFRVTVNSSVVIKSFSSLTNEEPNSFSEETAAQENSGSSGQLTPPPMCTQSLLPSHLLSVWCMTEALFSTFARRIRDSELKSETQI